MKLGEFLSTASALYLVIVSKDLAIWYHPFTDSSFDSHVGLQLIGSPDAGYAAIGKQCAMEDGIIVLVRAPVRDGPVLRFAHALWWLGRKMRRVARSSAGCESEALEMAADTIIWYRKITHEWRFGEFNYSPFPSDQSASLTAPFERPSLDSVSTTLQQVPSECFNVSRTTCNCSGMLSIASLVSNYRSIFMFPARLAKCMLFC